MTRLLEFITALVIVAVLGVVVGVLMPSSGHVERSLVISKDIRDVYDILNNFRRFPEYAVLRAYDPQMKYKLEGKAYGEGAAISWTSDSPRVGNGRLEITSSKPGFADVATTGAAQIEWKIDNDWRGHDKRFTIDLNRAGRQGKLVKIVWAYDVQYGWNLIDRYSNLYIHGDPDSLIQFSLGNLQNVLATIPNIDYGDLKPHLVDTPQQPILYVSTTAARTLNAVDAASDAAMKELQDAMKKLGVTQAGPRITFVDNFGDQNYDFDIAVPVSASSVTIDGKSYELTAPKQLSLADLQAAEAASAPAEGSSAPASAASAAAAAKAALVPGSRDKFGHLIVNDKVRGMLAFGGRALTSSWSGSPAGIPPTRLMLKAYAGTHGYRFDETANRLYDVQVVGYGDKMSNGQEAAYDQQKFQVYLPVSDAPEQTPEQEQGMSREPAPASSSSAPAAAGSAPAPAGSAAAAGDAGQ